MVFVVLFVDVFPICLFDLDYGVWISYLCFGLFELVLGFGEICARCLFCV